MTIVEIIAIVVMAVLCVLCVICIAAVLSSKRQASANSVAIRDIEKSLNSFGDSIKEQTGQLIEHLEQQQSDGMQERRLEFLEEEVRRLSSFDEIDLPEDVNDFFDKTEEPEDIEELGDEVELDELLKELNGMPAGGQPEPARREAQPAAAQPQIQPVPEPEMIWLQEQPVWEEQQPAVQKPPQQTAPQPAEQTPVQTVQQEEEPLEPSRYHRGYNIGRSGRKYTAEELNVLIRE